MSFFSSIASWFSSKDKKEKREEKVAWDKLDYGEPAKPDNLLPIDKDPWKT